MVFMNLPILSVSLHHLSHVSKAQSSDNKALLRMLYLTRLQKQGNYRVQKPCKASRRKNICGHVLMQAVYDASNKWVEFGKALVCFIMFNYPSLLTI